MRSQIAIIARLCILVTLLIIGACVHKPDTISINIVHNEKNVYLEHSVFSKGSGYYWIGPRRASQFKFSFELDDISTMNYAYMSIETFGVTTSHSISMNDEKIGVLWGYEIINKFERKKAETQMYIPKRYFKQGRNTLKIIAGPWEDFAIGRFDIVVVKVKQDLQANKVESEFNNKKYFPKQLRFFSKLTDEELYISLIKIPSLLTDLNYKHGVYKKKLSYVYSKIGDYYKWNGDYTKNLLYQEKAIEYERGENITSLWPYLKAKLALAYYHVGEYDMSLHECRKALESLKKIDTKEFKRISRSATENPVYLKTTIYAYMALAYFQLENYDLAEKYSKWVVEDDLGSAKEVPMALSLGDQILGHISTYRKDYRKAATHYQMAIYSAEAQPQIYKDLIAMAKLYRSNAHYLEGHYKEAAGGIHEVSEPTHEFKWRSHLLMGNIGFAENRFEEAIDQYSKSIEEIEFSRTKLGMHGFKINFMNDKQEPYQKIIGSLNKLGNNKKAFYYAEKAKARAFVDLIAATKEAAYHKNIQLKELSTEEKNLREKLIDLQNRLDSEQRMFQKRGVNEETKIKLENARSALNNFYITKAKQNEQFASLNAVDTLTIKEVMKLIPNGVSLVEYYYDPNHLYIWAIDNKQHHFIKKDILGSELEMLTKAYRKLVLESKDIRSLKVVKAREERSSDHKSRFEEVNDALESILIDGVFDHIKTDKIYIVPHGILHYLPFQSLTYNSNFLIESFQIGYIPSATALKYVLAKRKEKSESLLALGNPELNAPQMQLPFAEKEVQDLKSIYPAAMVLIGENASEAKFKQQAGAHGIVHVASHGEFNSATPLISCLRLSAGDEEDGRLETREIFSLNLDAYLITLSACNTAIGKLTKGDDVVGLARAFIFAGTPSILGTIWSVNDESTSIFMNHFYGNLREMDKLKSLQQAQIAMLRSEKYRHPYYWAGFQLIGDYY